MTSQPMAWIASSQIWIWAVKIQVINIGQTMIWATGLVNHHRGYAEIDGEWPE